MCKNVSFHVKQLTPKMGVLHKCPSILYYSQHGGPSYFMENVSDPIVNVLFMKTEQQN